MAHVVITGAGRGVGLELARQLVARGDTVSAIVRNPVTAARSLDALDGKGRVLIIKGDVTDESSLASAASALGDQPVDLLVCNAGILEGRGSIKDGGFDAAEWQRLLMTNIAGVFFTVRAFLPGLKRAKVGKIAVISSIMGTSAGAGGAAYTYRASKAGAANVGANLAVDLKPDRIAVGIYHPGWVTTDMGGPSAPVTPKASAKGLIARFDKLSLATTGVFEDYQGQTIPF